MNARHCQPRQAASLCFSGVLLRRLVALTVIFLLCHIVETPSWANARGVELTTTLRWGGNAEGGVPFIFYAPNDRTKLLGFEAEIAQALAQQMELKARFVQNV